ncbi:ATP synthase subunit beta [Striga asiatica]|uniref:ATP synthase subunit beta n=1 Tax=Striga asiatica TaxID=4170 RepID=A0A5A7QC78_STRAF|nr:ATP synthase subunit beta [Striga asiatica]
MTLMSNHASILAIDSAVVAVIQGNSSTVRAGRHVLSIGPLMGRIEAYVGFAPNFTTSPGRLSAIFGSSSRGSVGMGLVWVSRVRLRVGPMLVWGGSMLARHLRLKRVARLRPEIWAILDVSFRLSSCVWCCVGVVVGY